MSIVPRVHIFYSPHATSEQFVHSEAIIECLKDNRALGHRSVYVLEYSGFSPAMADSIGLPPLAVIQHDQDVARQVEAWYQKLLADQERIANNLLHQSDDVSHYRAIAPGQQGWTIQLNKLLASLADEGVEYVFCERVPLEVCFLGREIQKNERQRALQAYASGRPSDALAETQAYFVARRAMMERRELAFADLLKSILADPDVRIISTRGTHHYLYRSALDQKGVQCGFFLPPSSVFATSEHIPHPDDLLLRQDAYGEPVDQELVVQIFLQYVLHRFLSTYFMSTGKSLRDADIAARRTLEKYPVTINLFNRMSMDLAQSGGNRDAKSIGEFVFEALQEEVDS